MYAIIEDGDRQFKVEQGQELEIDYRHAAVGDEVTFDRVLAYRDEEGLKIGRPLLDAAVVTGQVLGIDQAPKLLVQKLRRRKNYRRRTGHRQIYTRVRIEKIEVP